MNRKNQIIISIIALIGLSIVILTSSKYQQETSLESGQLFLPNLKANLSQVDKVVIQHSGNKPISLIKSGDKWGVAEKSGYKANFPAIRKVLLELSQAELFEAKTQKEKNYIHLGVEEVTQEKGSGSRITIYSKDKVLEDVIIGRYRINKGTYLRKANQHKSWLTLSKLIVESRFIEWLDKDILNINEDNIQSVAYTPALGAKYEISRQVNKEGYKILYDGKVAAPKDQRATANLARLISEIKPVDVAPRVDGIDSAEVFSTRVYNTFDGLTITITCSKQKEGKAAQISFDFATSQQDSSSQIVELVKKYKQEISPWLFTIDDSIFGKLNKKLEDIADMDSYSAEDAAN